MNQTKSFSAAPALPYPVTGLRMGTCTIGCPRTVLAKVREPFVLSSISFQVKDESRLLRAWSGFRRLAHPRTGLPDGKSRSFHAPCRIVLPSSNILRVFDGDGLTIERGTMMLKASGRPEARGRVKAPKPSSSLQRNPTSSYSFVTRGVVDILCLYSSSRVFRSSFLLSAARAWGEISFLRGRHRLVSVTPTVDVWVLERLCAVTITREQSICRPEILIPRLSLVSPLSLWREFLSKRFWPLDEQMEKILAIYFWSPRVFEVFRRQWGHDPKVVRPARRSLGETVSRCYYSIILHLQCGIRYSTPFRYFRV